MNDQVQPLETLFEQAQGQALPLPAELLTLYGLLQFPLQAGKPYVIANFVSTLDGVISLNIPGASGGGPISGENPHDHLVMGLLRAVADAVIVGAGTLRAVPPEHRWTAESVYPDLGDAYQQLRLRLGKSEPPLNVIVTASGQLDLEQPLFQSGEVPVLIVTTAQGAAFLNARSIPPAVRVAGVQPTGLLSATAMIQAVCEARPCQLLLVEGGPPVLGDFLAEGLLNELFLTLAPQIAGRDAEMSRPGLVEGHRFAPEHPLWGTLISVKRGGYHLFFRYAFPTQGGNEVSHVGL
jgi:riboflavin biosynthesis pyrimidine reductase